MSIEAMSIERNSGRRWHRPTDLVRRAARHAVLGDPVRLRIVDLLTLGDRSPGELRADLGIGSNLLAHHLGVLIGAGMVERTRSEGDRRRSYVHLVPEGSSGVTPVPGLRARRIVFVCTGNSARSPLAAALWATLSPVPVASAGTHPAERTAPGALAVASRHGLGLGGHTPRDVRPVLAEGDAVVTLCDRAHEELGPVSTLHWSVPNPGVVGTVEAYEAAFAEIAARVARFAPRVAA